MMIDLAETLAVIHAEQIYHFDIKPDNILVDGSGRLVLCDFAASANHEEFHGGCSIGVTKGYTAPELQTAKDNPAAIREGDGRSDIYSLGVVFYEMLSDIRLPEEVKKDVAKPLPDYFRRLSRGVAATVSTGVEILAKLIDTPRQLSGLIPPRPQAEPVEDDSQNPPSQPLRQLVPELPKSIADLIDKMRAELGQRIDSATEVAQRLKAALRRDANPPMKRVKTVAMWGGWVATVLVAVGIGKTAEQLVFNWRSGGHFRTLAIGCLNPDSSRLVAMDWGMIQYLSAEVPTLFEWFRVPGPVEGESEITFKVQLPDETRFGLYWGAESIPNDPKRSVIFSGVELTSTRITGRPRQIRRFPGGHPFEVIPGQRVLTVTTSDFSIRHTLDQNNNPVDIPQLHAALVANLATPNRAINPLSFPLPYSEAGEIREIEVSLHFNHGVLTTITINNEQRNVIDQPNGRLSGSVGFFLESYQVFLSPPKFSRK
jgi:hypothetical protein